MNSVEQLRDIRGLDELPWWPLAPGWWLILAVMILLIIGIILFINWFLRRRHDWRRSAQKEWSTLARRYPDPREQLIQLNVLLRRIAMQQYGRQTCAGLTGERWLAWLTEHDPQGFNWLQSGRLLIELPYQPITATVSEQQLQILRQAAKKWIERGCQTKQR
jgi:hypothetical protein